MAYKISGNEVTDYMEAFSAYDKNNDGAIQVKELGPIMRSLGHYPTEKQMKIMIKEVDVDSSGTVSFPEFVTLMDNLRNGKECQLQEAFKAFDKNGSGFITASEFKRVMESMGEELTNKEIIAKMIAADDDGDGKVNYEEFVKLMVPSFSKTTSGLALP